MVIEDQLQRVTRIYESSSRAGCSHVEHRMDRQVGD
jgi:hypothetical protein